MEYRKYESIKRLGHKSVSNILEVGDEIIVEEKLDGANASFSKGEYQPRAFSRRKELFNTYHTVDDQGVGHIVMGDTLRGFLGWVHDKIHNHMLNPDYIYYGEWLVRHTVVYPEWAEYDFYLFDVYDAKTDTFLDKMKVFEQAYLLGIRSAPVLYSGKFESPKQLEQLVGKTLVEGSINGQQTGEGIVIKFTKPFTNYEGVTKTQRFVLKVVTDAFCEYKGVNLQKSPTASILMGFAKSVMTEARVEKALHKMVDEGVIPEQFTMKDFGTIAKNICPVLIDDVMQEESEELPENYDQKELIKCLNSMSMKMVKKIFAEKHA